MNVSTTVFENIKKKNGIAQNGFGSGEILASKAKDLVKNGKMYEMKEGYQEVMAQVEAVVGKGVAPKTNDLPKGEWSEQALKVLRERYLDKDDKELKETPDELVWRVAFTIASAEVRFGADKDRVMKTAKRFYELMASRKFLPNSPTLMNAGKGNGLQYSACFVLPVDDSLEGIFDGIKWQAIIHQSGGGTGMGYSRLRPKGAFVKTSRGVASGPVSFMRVYDAATQQIKQGGTRRGANMGMLKIDHPDIRDFITCKLEGGITNFNISVLATDKFMEALANDGEYDLIAPQNGQIVRQEKAREIFDLICESAWKSGDPGMVFYDRVNQSKANPVPNLGPIESTNPCGEQPLYGFDACNLGSIFLRYFVKEGIDGPEVDWEKLKVVTHLSVRFLDDVIEVNPYPLPQIWQTVRNIRRIGLGVGGWADMCFLLGLAYDSKEARDLGQKIMAFINEEGHKASEKLAEDRGPFPLWRESIYMEGRPLRNSTVTTIAPTGTISIIADNSSGIEPIFALAYRHTVKDEHINRELVFVNPVFKEVAVREGFWDGKLEDYVAEHGSVHGYDGVPEKWQRILVTAHEIRPNDHVLMQAAWQKSVDNAVSKTINLPNEAVVDDVAEAYLQAWNSGCMGITVYRDGSKSWQVLNVGSKTDKVTDDKGMVIAEAREDMMPAVSDEVAQLRGRPKKLAGATYEIKTPVGTAFVVVNTDELGNPFEVFVNVGKAGTHVMADAEALGRLISLSLRIPSPFPAKAIAEAVVEQLAGIGGAETIGFGNGKVRSLADAVAKILKEHLSEVKAEPGLTNGHAKESPLLEELATVRVLAQPSFAQGYGGAQQEALPLSQKRRDLCPECGQATLVIEEGCMKCHNCGASKC